MLHLWNRLNGGSYYDGYEPKTKKHIAVMICAGIIAFLLISIGLFQTVLVFGFSEGRRTPTLVLGPMFMGIGFLILISEVEMCLRQRKARKIAEAQAATVVKSDVIEEPAVCTEENEYYSKAGFPRDGGDVGILLRADQLQQILNAPYGDAKKNNDNHQFYLTVPLISTNDVNPNVTPTYQAKIPNMAVYPLSRDEEDDNDFSSSSIPEAETIQNEKNNKKAEEASGEAEPKNEMNITKEEKKND